MPKKALTDRLCLSLKPGPKRQDIPDAKAKGLVFRVSTSGVKSWSVRYRRQSDGVDRRYTIGEYPAVRVADAHAQAFKVQAEVLAGGDPAGEKRDRKKADTFAALAEDYIIRHAKKNKRSWQEDQRIINRELIPHIGKMKATEIRRRDVIRILDRIADRGSPVMSNRTLACVRKIFSWAENEDEILSSPVRGVTPRVREEPRQRALDNDEVSVFWTSLPSLPIIPAVVDILRLCLLTGQRVGEVTGMKREEINLKEAVWTIPRERTKNDRPHAVPLCPMSLEIIERVYGVAEGAYLFPSPVSKPRKGKPVKGDASITSLAPNRAIARNHTAMGLEKFTSHDLRRTFITGLARLGFDRLIIGKTVNHKSVDAESVTGSVYDTYKYLPERRRALEAWEQHLQGLLH